MAPKQLLPDGCIEVKLREYRERKGMSQEELARNVGVTRQTIISIENGKYLPSLSLALLISKLFQTRIEDLFRLKEECVPEEWRTQG